MDFSQLTQLSTDNLLLRQITSNDQSFIEDIFQDTDIAKYYIVPKEARQDYKRLIAYWAEDIRNEAGSAWIIIEKGKGLFSSDKKCGFIAFEFRGTTENARISYALIKSQRGKGIASKCVNALIEALVQKGVKTFEADIDRENLQSERVVERLGFTANKKEALVDPEMMRDGEIRFRALWKKDSSIRPYVQKWDRIPINADFIQLIPAINQSIALIKEKGEHPELVAKYLYLLGRIKFLEGKYDEAAEAFGKCNMVTYNNSIPDNHETFYWFAKMKEQKGESKSNILMYYNFALEHYNENPEIITKEEIIEAMNKI